MPGGRALAARLRRAPGGAHTDAHSNIYSDTDTHAGAGHIAQNVALAAVALGLGSCPVAAFYGEEVNGYWKSMARTKVRLTRPSLGPRGRGPRPKVARP